MIENSEAKSTCRICGEPDPTHTPMCHLNIRPNEEMQQFKVTTSSKKPRFGMIPYGALEALAERFDMGHKKHGENSWNALTNQAGLEDEAWVISRAEHIIHHVYQYLLKLKGLIPDDGDDDAGAILWGGCVLSEARRVKQLASLPEAA